MISDDSNLIEWTRLQREHTDGIDYIVDRKLEGKYPQDTYTKLVDLALMCASFQKNKRPSMKHVVSVLEPLLQSAERPPQNYSLQSWPMTATKSSPGYSSHTGGSAEDMGETFRTIGSGKKLASSSEHEAMKDRSQWVDRISRDVGVNDGKTI